MFNSPHSIPEASSRNSGMMRQMKIYELGLSGQKLSIPLPLSELGKKTADCAMSLSQRQEWKTPD